MEHKYTRDPFDYESIKLNEENRPDKFDLKVLSLNDIEFARYKEFKKNHRHPDVNKGSIGGHISILVTPTSIATGKKCICSICKQDADITDYTVW